MNQDGASNGDAADVYLELFALVEIVGRRPVVERRKGDVAAAQRRNVRVLRRAQGALLVAAPDKVAVRQSVRVPACGTTRNVVIFFHFLILI